MKKLVDMSVEELNSATTKPLVDMSVEELKAYKETIIEKIETHLPELCDDIDEVIAIKEKV
jgi:hypothetical protein